METELIEESFQQFPLTMEIEQSLKQFERGYHAVSIIEGITSNFIGVSETKFLTIEQFKRTEKGMIILVHSMICHYFPPIAKIPNERRLKFLQWFFKQFALLYRAEMTAKFSDSKSKYFVAIPGGIVDADNFDIFTDVSNSEEKKEFSKSFCILHFDFLNKNYRPLNICRLEFASLIGLLFWNSVERILSDFVEENIYTCKRDQFYAEIYEIITTNINICNTYSMLPSIRFGRLLDLLNSMALFSWETGEVFQMAKIFMDMPDLWDEINLPYNNFDKKR